MMLFRQSLNWWLSVLSTFVTINGCNIRHLKLVCHLCAAQSAQRRHLCAPSCLRPGLLDWLSICLLNWLGLSPTSSVRSASVHLIAGETQSLRPCCATARASWTLWPKIAWWTSSHGYRWENRNTLVGASKTFFELSIWLATQFKLCLVIYYGQRPEIDSHDVIVSGQMSKFGCTWWQIWKVSLFSQIFPNADLRLLKQCVSVRDKLLQKEYDKHKVWPATIIYLQLTFQCICLCVTLILMHHF